jgi:hypothetical protein
MSSAGAPGDRFYFAAWTETELLIWSNNADNGSAAYNPTVDTWRPISSENDPYSAEGPVVWTGREMLIWAGSSSDPGGRYDPKADQWAAMSRVGQPSARRGAVGVWTGTEMIVWGGGLSGMIDLADGGRYTP